MVKLVRVAKGNSLRVYILKVTGPSLDISALLTYSTFIP